MKGRIVALVSVAAVIVALIFLSHRLALGQTGPIPIDLSKGQFSWTWTKGTSGDVERWILRCGPSSGQYSLIKEINDPAARSAPLNTIITFEGTYYCVVQAANAFGASGYSPEVSFRAGKVPGAANTLEVLVQ